MWARPGTCATGCAPISCPPPISRRSPGAAPSSTPSPPTKPSPSPPRPRRSSWKHSSSSSTPHATMWICATTSDTSWWPWIPPKPIRTSPSSDSGKTATASTSGPFRTPTPSGRPSASWNNASACAPATAPNRAKKNTGTASRMSCGSAPALAWEASPPGTTGRAWSRRCRCCGARSRRGKS